MLQGVFSYHTPVGEALVERGLVLFLLLPWLFLLDLMFPAGSRAQRAGRWALTLLFIDRTVLDYRFWLPIFAVITAAWAAAQSRSRPRQSVLLLLAGLAGAGLGANAINSLGVPTLVALVCMVGIFFVSRTRRAGSEPNGEVWVPSVAFAITTAAFSLIVDGVAWHFFLPAVLIAFVGYVLLAFSYWRQQRGRGEIAPGRTRGRQAAALMAASLCVTWIGLELFFRHVYDYSDANGSLRTVNYWAKRHVQRNSWGFRDREWPTLDNLPAGLRVLLLGDSFTFGWGIDNVEDTLGRQIEIALQKRVPGPVQVFSMGIGGINTAMEAEMFATQGRLLQPHVVILQYHLNDIDMLDKPISRRPGWYEMWRPVTACSDAAELLGWHAFLLIASKSSSHRFNDSVMDYDDPARLTAQQARVTALVEAVRQTGAAPVSVVFPFMERPTDTGPQRSALDTVKALYDRLGVPCLDVSRMVVLSERRYHANRFDPHPSPELIRVVAPEVSTAVVNALKSAATSPATRISGARRN